jgi:hypothetical protein
LRLERREHEVFGPVEVAENNLAGRRRKKIELKDKALTVFNARLRRRKRQA